MRGTGIRCVTNMLYIYVHVCVCVYAHTHTHTHTHTHMHKYMHVYICLPEILIFLGTRTVAMKVSGRWCDLLKLLYHIHT